MSQPPERPNRPDGSGGVPITDRGLLLGDGLFDTAMVLDGRVVWRDAHLERLLAGCATLGIDVRASDIATAMDAAAQDVTAGSVRTTITRGSGARGVVPKDCGQPTLFASTATGLGHCFAPRRLTRTTIRRNDTSPTSRLKTLNYLDAIFAMRTAQETGFDDAIMLNTAGNLACSTIANIFLLCGNRLITPSTDQGILQGIARQQIIKCAPQVGLSVAEGPVNPAQLDDCDGIFLSNSLMLLAPVTKLDGRNRWPSTPPVLRALATALLADIERDTGCDPRPHLPMESLPA